MNYRQLAYGVASFLPGASRVIERGTGGGESALYCYTVWMRHLALARASGMPGVPKVIAELGPGDSIGVGLAALICGAERYLALDVVEHAVAEKNLAVFDGLVDLYSRRVPVPGLAEFPEMLIDIPADTLSLDCLLGSGLGAALLPERIEWLRAQVVGRTSDRTAIAYRVPWQERQLPDRGSVDFILSNAVLEHVEDVPETYQQMLEWLKPGGYASHQIDFRSHSLFTEWDGHWACPDWLWFLMKGRRKYLLNRFPFSYHQQAAADAAFESKLVVRYEAHPESKSRSDRILRMSREDRTTACAYMLHRKR